MIDLAGLSLFHINDEYKFGVCFYMIKLSWLALQMDFCCYMKSFKSTESKRSDWFGLVLHYKYIISTNRTTITPKHEEKKRMQLQ